MADLLQGDSWTMKEFYPMQDIPQGVYLTIYGGGTQDFMDMPLLEMVKLVEDGKLKIPIGKVFKLDQLPEAHEQMETNAVRGKGVVVVH